MKLGAIVAGATGGIGKAVATNLSKKYKYILLLGRDEYKLTSLVEDLSERFPDNKYFDATADITYLKDVEYVVSDFAKICDRVDLMVNAAGILFTGTSDITYDKLIKLIEVNFIGVYNLTQSVLPQMKKNNKGKIIHILSMSATRSMPGVGGYSASKSAAASYLDSLIKDTIDTNINITSVNPGYVATEMTHNSTKLKQEEMLTPENVASVVDFIVNVPSHVVIKEINLQCRTQIAKIFGGPYFQ